MDGIKKVFKSLKFNLKKLVRRVLTTALCIPMGFSTKPQFFRHWTSILDRIVLVCVAWGPLMMNCGVLHLFSASPSTSRPQTHKQTWKWSSLQISHVLWHVRSERQVYHTYFRACKSCYSSSIMSRWIGDYNPLPHILTSTFHSSGC